MISVFKLSLFSAWFNFGGLYVSCTFLLGCKICWQIIVYRILLLFFFWYFCSISWGSPFSFLILFIWVISLFFLVSLARDLSVLLPFKEAALGFTDFFFYFFFKLSLSLSLFFFFFFFFFGLFRAVPEAYGSSQAKSNWNCSCWLKPQPQQHGVWATPATYTTAHGNARSLTQWVRPGVRPTSSWILVGFLTS